MEINLKQLGSQAIDSSVGQKRMRLSDNATSMVFQLFTKNVYSNPIGTIVREITSNCFDSHIEAGVNLPVLIKKSIDNQTQTTYISFIDFGVGMSPDRIDNIYGVYFESTKRVDNEQIGGWGVGGKSPLAYKRSTGHGEGEYDNSFYVITVHNGMKYYYCIFEGTESPIISLLHSEATTDGNGTEVRIPVLERDVNTFIGEMTRQLYYFENLVFEGFENTSLMNEYQITRTKTFLYRGNQYLNNVHVCLGRVAYPIDYNVLGLNSNDYNFPIALRLEVGDIGVTVSRESLDYSESTIKTLKKKLGEAKMEMIEMLTKQYDSVVTLKDYFNAKKKFGTLTLPNGGFSVGNLIQMRDVVFTNFKYSLTRMPDDKELFKLFFNHRVFGKKPSTRHYGSNKQFVGGYDTLTSKTNILYIEDEFVRKVIKQSYLKSLHETYYIVERNNLLDNSMRGDISETFNVHLDKLVDDSNNPVAYVKTLMDIQEEYFDIVRENSMCYDTLIVPEDFKANNKYGRGVTKELRNTTIPVKLMGGYSKVRVKLEKLFDFNMPIIYGVQGDESKLDSAYDVFKLLFDKKNVISYYDTYRNTFTYNNGKKGIIFILLSQTNIKYMKHCKNAIPVDQFYNKMLYRKHDVITNYFQSLGITEKYDKISKIYKSSVLGKLNAKYGRISEELKLFIEPLTNQNSDLAYYKQYLSNYIELDNFKTNKELEKNLAAIDLLLKLQDDNRKMLSYINLPTWDFNSIDADLLDLLKTIMKF